MEIYFRGRMWAFRECDTKGKTEGFVISQADKYGEIQYEPRAVWLVVPGVGYGWEVEEARK